MWKAAMHCFFNELMWVATRVYYSVLQSTQNCIFALLLTHLGLATPLSHLQAYAALVFLPLMLAFISCVLLQGGFIECISEKIVVKIRIVNLFFLYRARFQKWANSRINLYDEMKVLSIKKIIKSGNALYNISVRQ